MARSPFTGFATLCLTIGLIASFAVSAASAGAGGTVVVPRGQPLQLAFTASTAELGGLSSAIENAVRMAIERHPTVRGFPVQLNAVETPCEGDSTASATAIVANTQNTAVIGNLCSAGFVSALPIYEAAGVVVVSGSATADFLPGAAESTVFNRTIGRDGDGAAAWMAQVATLPSVQAWNQAYRAEFGTPAPDLAPFYADAASLLLDRMERGSKVVHGNLVVDRADLAAAVRDTIRFKGVTCAIALDPATGNRVNDPRALAHCANYQPVVVQPGQPVQIAFANDLTGFASAFGSNFSHAVQMAVEAHPTVRGFPIQVNTVDSPCGDPRRECRCRTADRVQPAERRRAGSALLRRLRPGVTGLPSRRTGHPQRERHRRQPLIVRLLRLQQDGRLRCGRR
jgi:ABC-type branched-subunit amino acid transport system substrate-binding protein